MDSSAYPTGEHQDRIKRQMEDGDKKVCRYFAMFGEDYVVSSNMEAWKFVGNELVYCSRMEKGYKYYRPNENPESLPYKNDNKILPNPNRTIIVKHYFIHTFGRDAEFKNWSGIRILDIEQNFKMVREICEEDKFDDDYGQMYWYDGSGDNVFEDDVAVTKSLFFSYGNKILVYIPSTSIRVYDLREKPTVTLGKQLFIIQDKGFVYRLYFLILFSSSERLYSVWLPSIWPLPLCSSGKSVYHQDGQHWAITFYNENIPNSTPKYSPSYTYNPVTEEYHVTEPDHACRSRAHQEQVYLYGNRSANTIMTVNLATDSVNFVNPGYSFKNRQRNELATSNYHLKTLSVFSEDLHWHVEYEPDMIKPKLQANPILVAATDEGSQMKIVVFDDDERSCVLQKELNHCRKKWNLKVIGNIIYTDYDDFRAVNFHTMEMLWQVKHDKFHALDYGFGLFWFVKENSHELVALSKDDGQERGKIKVPDASVFNAHNKYNISGDRIVLSINTGSDQDDNSDGDSANDLNPIVDVLCVSHAKLQESRAM